MADLCSFHSFRESILITLLFVVIVSCASNRNFRNVAIVVLCMCFATHAVIPCMDVAKIEVIKLMHIVRSYERMNTRGENKTTDGSLETQEMILLGAIAKLTGTLSKVCPSHGIDHAIRVAHHARMALRHHKEITETEKLAVLLTALLHDADDTKLFPKNKNYENARVILRKFYPKLEDLVIKMIGFVSTSKNGNTIPDEAKERPWLLIPRHADRLEAIGNGAIMRCWTYTKGINRPLFTESTPIVKTETELWKVATNERFKKYAGDSKSMLDHYDDKLLHIFAEPSGNEYFDTHAKKRRQVMIDFRLKFAGTLTDTDVQKYAELLDEEFDECFDDHTAMTPTA